MSGEQTRRTVEHGPDPAAGGARRASGGLSDARSEAADHPPQDDHPRPAVDMEGAEPGALGPEADERETERLAPASSQDTVSH
ncbi:MAG: hypothetical protein ACOY5Y_17655 [Pseudomonadota bacterium]